MNSPLSKSISISVGIQVMIIEVEQCVHIRLLFFTALTKQEIFGIFRGNGTQNKTHLIPQRLSLRPFGWQPLRQVENLSQYFHCVSIGWNLCHGV